MENKYINAKDLELEISHYLQCEKESETITLEELNEIASRFPTADVVEVVRCKDCKHHKGLNCPIMKHKFTHDNDYCSYGERRESIKRQGKWINHTEYGVTTYITDKDVECSECGHRQPKLFDMNYCPNCGADMREERNRMTELKCRIKQWIYHIHQWLSERGKMKGSWVECESMMICNCCGKHFLYADNDTDEFYFCPNCGADMREQGEANEPKTS